MVVPSVANSGYQCLFYSDSATGVTNAKHWVRNVADAVSIKLKLSRQPTSVYEYYCH